MKLSHYTDRPLELDRERTYVQPDRPFAHQKPRGFWVSVDGPDDWKDWCIGEEYGLDSLTHRTVVALSPTANVLVLDSVAKLLSFTVGFSKLDAAYAHIEERLRPGMSGIDWPTVAEQYDGIIITPYQWQCRMLDTTSWYYGWDCASGCIWNLDVLSVVPAEVDA